MIKHLWNIENKKDKLWVHWIDCVLSQQLGTSVKSLNKGVRLLLGMGAIMCHIVKVISPPKTLMLVF